MGTNLLVLSYLAFFIVGGFADVINVLDHGAVGDGQKDDTNALYNAWSIACNNTASQTVLVPAGKTFLVSAVRFTGPCKSLVHVQVDGNIVAPGQMWQRNRMENWITFWTFPGGITVNGSGQFDGRGSVWWGCRLKKKCSDAPNIVAFGNSNNVTVSGLRFLNSPMKHITFYGVNGGSLSGLTITAPKTSPNTDGIYIALSQQIDISNSRIGTGDDCISIGNQASNINITEINCGPGHGISIGSLGGGGSKASVNQIHVSNSHLQGTQNGVRIKTWPGGSGLAKDITFENVNFTKVQNPIIIDQFYCEHGRGCAAGGSAVQIQDVHYIGVVGTTTSRLAITLNCSPAAPCTGITMNNVNIQSVRRDRRGRKVASGAYCNNVRGIETEPVHPAVRCLK